MACTCPCCDQGTIMRKPRALHAGSRHPTHAGARDDLEKETPLKKRRGSHYTPFEKLPAKKVGAIDEGPPGQEKHKSCIRWGDSPAHPSTSEPTSWLGQDRFRACLCLQKTIECLRMVKTDTTDLCYPFRGLLCTTQGDRGNPSVTRAGYPGYPRGGRQKDTETS